MTTVTRRAFLGTTAASAALAASAKVSAAGTQAQGLTSFTKDVPPITAQEHAARIAKLQYMMQQRGISSL